jgi:hypothetical protein
MTPEAQRIAIAEACGWKECERCTRQLKPKSDGVEIRGLDPTGDHTGGWKEYALLPDYLNDLNAAIFLCDFLAERSWNCTLGNGLDKTWECEFYKSATDKTHPDNLGQRDGKQIELHYGSADTLAEAISEAFLRTIGLWKD